jgi:hypothetical protein
MQKMLTLSFVCLMASAQAQNGGTVYTPPSGIKFQETYTEEEIRYHTVQDGTPVQSLSPVDIPLLNFTRKRVTYIETVRDDGNHSYSSTILNPDELYAQWPVKIGRFEGDSSGMRIYKTNDTLYHEHKADSVEIAEYAETRDFYAQQNSADLFTFPMPDSISLAAQMDTTEDMTVQYLDSGSVLVSSQEYESLYEPAARRITHSRYEGERLQEKNVTTYKELQPGIFVVGNSRSERFVIRPSGLCMREVVLRFHKDQQVGLQGIEQRSAGNLPVAQGITLLRPNPASDILQLQLSEQVRSGSTLLVYDATGRLYHQLSSVQPNTNYTIVLKEWPKGVYVVRIETGVGAQMVKFLKY